MENRSVAGVAWIALTVLLVAANCSAGGLRPDPIPRITVQDARAAVQANEALLVCAYSDDRCADMLLEGAMLLQDLERKIPYLPDPPFAGRSIPSARNRYTSPHGTSSEP